MTRIGLVLILNLLLTLTAWADETLPFLKVGADYYSNVTITAVTPLDIYFTCDKGMANAKLKNLDPALQQHFKFDAAKAAIIEKQLKSPIPANTLGVAAVTDPTIERTNAQVFMDDAITKVKAIVNQPVRQLAMTGDMRVAKYSPGWFHPGAIKPEFDTVDVRTTQETPYDQRPYVTSDQNPGWVFIGPELEFNSMTKYFYTDRSLPKARLSQTEMLEINRLYRIIGKCEAALNSSPDQNSQPMPPLSLGYLSLHKTVIIEVALGVVLVLVALRFMTGRRPG